LAVTDVHGSQTAVINTEHTLADTSAAGTYQLSVDPINMAAGDSVTLRIYEMVLTSGTRRVVYCATFTGVQPTDDMIKISIPISTALTDSGAVRATLQQTAGTGRVFPWNLKKFA
jgi:hypothetical protein